MEPIISPYVIYAINTIGKIQEIAYGFSIACFVGGIIIFAFWDDDINEVDIPFKALSIISLVAFILGVFLPTKETMIQMAAASYITPDNINLGKDYIIEIIKEVTKEVGMAK